VERWKKGGKREGGGVRGCRESGMVESPLERSFLLIFQGERLL